jgi:hypothetical protein
MHPLQKYHGCTLATNPNHNNYLGISRYMIDAVVIFLFNLYTLVSFFINCTVDCDRF